MVRVKWSGFRFRLLCSLGLLCLLQSLIVYSLSDPWIEKEKGSRNGKLMHQYWKYGTGDNSLQSPGPNALKGFVRILQNSNFERKLISLETLQWRVCDPVYNSFAIFTQFSSHSFTTWETWFIKFFPLIISLTYLCNGLNSWMLILLSFFVQKVF